MESAILQCISQRFDRYIDLLHDRLDIDRDELESMLCGRNCRVEPKKPIKQVSSSSEKQCKARIKSGARKDQECGKKISDKSKTGDYCGVHLKLESEIAHVDKTEKIEDEGKICFKKSRWGNFIYGSTGLVLDPKIKKIIGVEDKDGNICALDIDHIELCKLRELPYIIKE